MKAKTDFQRGEVCPALARPRWGQRGGLVLGSPGTSRIQPPPALPVVEIAQCDVGSSGVALEVIMQRAVRAYCSFGKYKGACHKFTRNHGIWNHNMLLLARSLQSGGLSPEGYVNFVCAQAKTFPFPQQVFGANAMTSWLREYLKHGSRVNEPPTYAQTEERRRAYEERIASAKLRLHR